MRIWKWRLTEVVSRGSCRFPGSRDGNEIVGLPQNYLKKQVDGKGEPTISYSFPRANGDPSSLCGWRLIHTRLNGTTAETINDRILRVVKLTWPGRPLYSIRLDEKLSKIRSMWRAATGYMNPSAGELRRYSKVLHWQRLLNTYVIFSNGTRTTELDPSFSCSKPVQWELWLQDVERSSKRVENEPGALNGAWHCKCTPHLCKEVIGKDRPWRFPRDHL